MYTLKTDMVIQCVVYTNVCMNAVSLTYTIKMKYMCVVELFLIVYKVKNSTYYNKI